MRLNRKSSRLTMPHLPLTEASIPNSIDLKANGEVSRMRSHKGTRTTPSLRVRTTDILLGH